VAKKSAHGVHPALSRFARDVLQRLRKARGEADLTQGEVAALLGTTVQRVSSIETGRSNITIETLERFANALGYEPNVSLKKRRRPNEQAFTRRQVMYRHRGGNGRRSKSESSV
jgi:transcriptional regulator with XRE-family HTH domain